MAVLPRRFAAWTVLCLFGALPSFILAGLLEPHTGAVGLGVLTFVLMLTAASCTERFNRLKRQPAWRRAIRITFMIRVAMTVLVPFGWFPDLVAGFASVAVTQTLATDLNIEFNGFAGTLITTLVQGSLLLSFLLLLLLAVHGTVSKSTPVPPHLKGLCVGCGYDLRGTAVTGVCPERGAVVTNVPAK